MPTLRISSRTQIYGDVVPGQMAEPLQRFVDWERFASGMAVREAYSDRKVVAPGQTLSLANVSVISGVAAGALYDLKAHPTKTGRYQVRYMSGAVANPLAALGTSIAVVGHTYAVTTSTDGNITVTDTTASPSNFGLARGDKVYISGAVFDDAGPFGAANQGFWTVVSCSAVGANPGAALTLKRADITDTTGATENVTCVAATDIQKVTPVTAVFVVGAPAYAGVWTVKESASGWFSIDSSVVLPDLLDSTLSVLTLATTEFLGYSRVEVDGMALVESQSGDLTSGSQIIRPVKFVDPLAAPVGGWYELYGCLTSLSVQNVSDAPVGVNTILAYLVD